MATTNTQGKISIEVEPYALKNLFTLLNSLDKEAQGRVRDAAQPLSKRLAGQLIQSAESSRTPQARLVALSISTPRDRVIKVSIGGSKKVGRGYGGVPSKNGKKKVKLSSAPAGALLWGSEHGSHPGVDSMGRKYSMRFGVGRSKYGYWIAPVVDDYVPIVAKEYVSIIQGIANDLGLN